MQLIAVLVMVIPWLNPFATGPSPAAVPLLTSMACFALFLLFTSGKNFDLVAIATKSWLVAALVSAAIALIQYFGASAIFSPWINNTSAGEAFANLRQRNQFATLTNVGLASLLWVIASPRPPYSLAEGATHSAISTKPQLPVAWAMAVAALLATGNAASSSRTGLVELLLLSVIFACWGCLKRAEVRGVTLTAGLVYCVAVFALPRLVGLDPSASGMLARLHDGGAACASRLVLWSNVLHLIAQKPWSGWGWGELDYAHFTTLYPGARFCDILDNAHNLPLHLAVELGVPVAVLVCGLGLWLVWRSRPWRETDPSRQMAWAVLAVILLHSMLEYPLWYGPFQIAAGLCVWILWSTRQAACASADADGAVESRGDGHGRTRAFVASNIAACTAVIFLAGIAYAGWDYRRTSQIYLDPDMRAPAYRENTMAKINDSWLFHNQVQFAELTTTDVTADNAQHINAMAHELLHFSPETRVVEKLIDSALVLGRDAEAIFFRARFQAAFPSDYARWVELRRASAAAQPPHQ
jgi:hypothetical protein